MKLIKITYNQYDEDELCYRKRAILGFNNENLTSYEKFMTFLNNNFKSLVNKVSKSDFDELLNEHKTINYSADYGLMGFESEHYLTIAEINFSEEVLVF